MHFSAIFGSYSYDPVKQKFEPQKYVVSKCDNETRFTALYENKGIFGEMGTTTINIQKDPPQGGNHGNHTDVYPNFMLRSGPDTTLALSNWFARTRTNNVNANSTRTKKKKTRRRKKRRKLEKKRNKTNPHKTFIISV